MIQTLWKRIAALQPHILYVAPAIILAPIVVLALVVAFREPSAPFIYTRAEYMPERAVYAPGETLIYTASLIVDRPGAVTLVRGFRVNAPGTRKHYSWAVLCDGTNAPSIQPSGKDTPPPFPQAARGFNVEGRIAVVIPNLPPGNYWLVSSVSKLGGGEAITQAPFTVRQTCHGNG